MKYPVCQKQIVEQCKKSQRHSAERHPFAASTGAFGGNARGWKQRLGALGVLISLGMVLAGCSGPWKLLQNLAPEEAVTTQPPMVEEDTSTVPETPQVTAANEAETEEAPMEETEEAPAAVELTQEEETYLRTLLSAVGEEQFYAVSDLSAETIGAILLTMPDISYVSYNTADYIPYLNTEDGYVMISSEDLAVASEAIFGRTVTTGQMSAIALYGGYEINYAGCYRLNYNGRGGNSEVVIDDVVATANGLEVSYRYLSYGTAESSLERTPTEQTPYVAVFAQNESNDQYPYQIVSNLWQGNLMDQEQFSVISAYRQMIKWGLSLGQYGASMHWCSLLQQDPYDIDDYYTPDYIWAYIVQDIDLDGVPELLLCVGEADTAFYILDYTGESGFSMVLIEGQKILVKDNSYYTIGIYGGYELEDEMYQVLYRIDPNTFQIELLEERPDNSYTEVAYTWIDSSLDEIFEDISTFY